MHSKHNTGITKTSHLYATALAPQQLHSSLQSAQCQPEAWPRQSNPAALRRPAQAVLQPRDAIGCEATARELAANGEAAAAAGATADADAAAGLAARDGDFTVAAPAGPLAAAVAAGALLAAGEGAR